MNLDAPDLPDVELAERQEVQLLDPDGRYDADSPWNPELSDDTLREMYRWMVLTRRVDREMINLQRQGQLGVYPSCLGQEGAQIGAAFALGEQDWVFPQYRELGLSLYLGVPQAASAHLWRGTWGLGYDPHEFRFAPISIPIGTQALHATGFALGARLDGRSLATVACVGDGATSTGDVHAAMTFAAVMRAPTVFFIQNNRYAISVPLEKQTAAPTLAHKAIGYGMPGWRCDGNDVIATYAVVHHALERARAGEGPALVEAMTYRMEAHTTSDDPTRYRSEEELDEARLTDPILRLRRLLESRSALDEQQVEQVDQEAERMAAEVRAGIYDAPHGDPTEIFDHVYVDATGRFEQQRAQLQAELAGTEQEQR